MSLDLQYYGYPPCCDQFDFVTITASNASTGVVTFANNSLRYTHRADFPDGPSTGGAGGNEPCGKARIWPLNSTQNDDARGALPCPWNVSHIYRGITINQLAGGSTYYQQVGRSIKMIDCTTIGISPTQIQFASFERCRFLLQSEQTS